MLVKYLKGALVEKKNNYNKKPEVSLINTPREIAVLDPLQQQ